MKIAILTHAHSRNVNVVGAIHYANEFVKMGHDVLLVTTPLSVLQILFQVHKRGVRSKLLACLRTGAGLSPSVRELIPLSMLPFGLLPILGKLLKKQSAFMLSRLPIQDREVVFVESPFFIDYLSNFKGRVIYRVTDNYPSFYNVKDLVEEKRSVDRAHSVVATSIALSNHLKSKYALKNVPQIDNGIDLRLFSKSKKSIDRIRSGCVYIGSFDFRFDFDLIEKLAYNKTVKIDLYGECNGRMKKQLLSHPNVNYCGVIKYNELPKILRKYSVGLMPFLCNEANLSRSPMKLYEYLYSGLYVVSKGVMLKSEPNLSSCSTDKEFISKTLYYLKLNQKRDYPDLDIKLGWEYKASVLLGHANE